MKFRLIYEGEIAPRLKIKVSDIHTIRQALDPQFRRLWNFEPLVSEASNGFSSPTMLAMGFSRSGEMQHSRLLSQSAFICSAS
jgi:hypothetical protein